MCFLNSFLFGCEGMDVDYMLEDDFLLDIEFNEDDEKLLEFLLKLKY